MTNFNFGKNWQDYSDNALNKKKFYEASRSLEDLIGKENIVGKTILDIGSGSGLFSIAAKELGASKVVGVDISKESVEAAQSNAERFNVNGVVFQQKSILDSRIEELGKFDIVYSWGVLHHTGDMKKAIENATSLVAQNGLFVIAIYNRHWSSPLWSKIKHFYNVSPRFIQKVMIYMFVAVIFCAKFAVTKKNPLKNQRGMNFYYDVI
ncbi:class I SAM-dependent methyltransferase, partial [Candidatus Peregrinibacteria bacterium]|nr:class I SAM-dependent methyltransferase [Candidatus Peregrinibacteria bacterium]